MTTVLVIRDLAASNRTAKKLAKLGYSCEEMPLFTYQPVQFKTKHSHYDHLIITSEKALNASQEVSYAQLHGVGKAVLQLGGCSYSNSLDLGNAVAKLSGKILYLRGRDISRDLSLFNKEIEQQICYEMVPIINRCALPRFDVVFLYSKRQAEALLKVMPSSGGLNIAICISRQVAQVVSCSLRVLIAHEPNENSMIEVLCNLSQ